MSQTGLYLVRELGEAQYVSELPERADMRVLVAGAGGAIGRRLVPQLAERGYDVVATTRSSHKTADLRALGARPEVVDGLDATSVGEVVARTAPDVVIHQMTALARLRSMRHFDREFAATNALRTKGTDNLIAASRAIGVRRFIAQSFTGWPNARDGGRVKTEADPLDPHPPQAQRQTLAAISYLERAVTSADGIEGIALRYGGFYGPGASDSLIEMIRQRKLPLVGSGAGVWSFIHIDDAAAATIAAIKDGPPGVYNIVDDDPAPVSDWLPHVARVLGARPPRRIPEWLARLSAGDVAVSLMTRVRGSSNAQAKQQLGWQPAWPSWRQGFVDGLG